MTLLAAPVLAATLAAPPDLGGTTWVLRGLAPGGTLTSAGALEPRLTLQLGGTRLSGSTGCNRYAGNVQVSPGRLKVAPLAVTRRICSSRTMNVERDFLALLQGAERYAVQGSTLTIYARGAGRLVFTAAGGTVTEPNPASTSLSSPALGGTWQIQEVRLGTERVTPPAGAVLTLQGAGAEWQLSGSAGCNRLSARGTLTGRTLTFGGVAATRMFCEDMAAERALTELLRAPVQVARSGNRMVWQGAEGRLTLRRAAQAVRPALRTLRNGVDR